ncbi:MAG: hypothetical protein ABJE47_07235 [bacterium]
MWFDSGNVGSAEIRGAGPAGGAPTLVVVRGVTGLVLLIAAVVWIARDARSSEAVFVFEGVLCLYLLASYWLHVEPDYDNVGLLGGLINDPFRTSDNVNRTLAGIKALLMPGRFVSRSLVGMVVLMRGRRTIALPPRD